MCICILQVLVVGNPANTNALICSHYAPSIPKENFSAMTRWTLDTELYCDCRIVCCLQTGPEPRCCPVGGQGGGGGGRRQQGHHLGQPLSYSGQSQDFRWRPFNFASGFNNFTMLWQVPDAGQAMIAGRKAADLITDKVCPCSVFSQLL